ncbi:FmdB family zinc ribbon protein [Xanthobacter sp. TB0136]|uniref:FmdB family zinc ribbon protein n=1 Tax=Xanthobacter sp. TB0136 TaxID=3459177 RepID=UPI004039D6A9
MPVYDYLCEDCGPFTQMHPMSACEEAQPCPECKAFSPRAFFTAPHIAGMDAGRRNAFSTNERSSNAPMSVGEYGEKTARAKSHGSGCGCCAPRMQSRTRVGPGGAKSFPSARPWMISH